MLDYLLSLHQVKGYFEKFVPKGQHTGQLHRPPRPDAVAALGNEQRRRKPVATDTLPDCVVTGDKRAQLCDRRLNEELFVEPSVDLLHEHRCVVPQNGHVLLKFLDRIRRRGVPLPVGNLVPEDAPKDGAQACAYKQLPLLPLGSAACAASLPRDSEQVRPILDDSANPPQCQRGGVKRHLLQSRMRRPLPQ